MRRSLRIGSDWWREDNELVSQERRAFEDPAEARLEALLRLLLLADSKEALLRTRRELRMGCPSLSLAEASGRPSIATVCCLALLIWTLKAFVGPLTSHTCGRFENVGPFLSFVFSRA